MTDDWIDHWSSLESSQLRQTCAVQQFRRPVVFGLRTVLAASLPCVGLGRFELVATWPLPMLLLLLLSSNNSSSIARMLSLTSLLTSLLTSMLLLLLLLSLRSPDKKARRAVDLTSKIWKTRLPNSITWLRLNFVFRGTLKKQIWFKFEIVKRLRRHRSGPGPQPLRPAESRCPLGSRVARHISRSSWIRR